MNLKISAVPQPLGYVPAVSLDGLIIWEARNDCFRTRDEAECHARQVFADAIHALLRGFDK